MTMPVPSQRIVLVDLRIPFFRLVFFFVKAALAAFFGGGDLDVFQRLRP